MSVSAIAGTLLAALLLAQTPTPLQKHAAALATHHAREVTLLDEAGKPYGTLSLQPIGRTRTRVTLHVRGTNRPRSVITLHRGSDCSDPALANGASAITLNPVNSASQISQTIVALPIGTLGSGDYLLDVRNATQARAFAETCARIGGGSVTGRR